MCLLSSPLLQAQNTQPLRGVIMANASSTRVGGVRVENQQSGLFTLSNALGIFQIRVNLGDTLVFTKDYDLLKKVVVSSHTDMIVQVKMPISLQEAVVNVQSYADQSQAILEAYSRKNGIYYEGKPPLWLLNPINGRPLTFFRELFSKDAKRVRRMARTVQEEERLLEINRLFSDELIKRAIGIDGEELKSFKEKYTPDLEKLRNWTEYEKMDYIRKHSTPKKPGTF